MLTTGWPNPKNPNSSPFIYRQYQFLKKHGIEVDVFHLQSNHNPINYLNNDFHENAIKITKKN